MEAETNSMVGGRTSKRGSTGVIWRVHLPAQFYGDVAGEREMEFACRICDGIFG
jgi:hypothetical protein